MEGSSEQIVKANPPLSQVCCTAIPSMICRLQTAPLIYLPVRHTLQTYGVSDRDLLKGRGYTDTPTSCNTHATYVWRIVHTRRISQGGLVQYNAAQEQASSASRRAAEQ